MDKGDEQAACNGDQHEADPIDNMDENAAAKEKLTAADPNKVKFTSVNLDGYDGKNGEAKVDIHVTQTTVGMGKEELLKYANEPFWVRLRMFLFIFFWISWIAMLVGAIVIILLAPRCPPAPTLKWYQKTAMYQVDVETFKDSDGDGIGDFKGLASKLDYLKDQNVGTLMLSAFYTSDSDTDAIVKHKEVDSRFGTLEDLDELLNQLKEKDIKLVIDFNPNHSSDKHPWFAASVDGQQPYSDFYVWAESPANNEHVPPNNWLSVEGDSAWTWNKDRGQFYLHTFGPDKPDLNLRNELVRQELREIVKYWLEKGVDGLKVVAASHLIEDESLRDEPLAADKTVNSPKYKDVNHIYTVDRPENLGLFAEWREILQNFTASTGIPKILMAEVSGSLNTSVLYYGNETFTLAELPINTHLTEINEMSSGIELQHHLDLWTKHSPEGAWPTLLVGSKKVQRLASRVGEELVDGMHMVAFIAKGTPITYYGDELGITDTYAKFPTDKVQENDKQSHMKIYRRLLALRGQPALNFGLQAYPLVTDEIFSMIRVRKGSPGYLVVVNMGGNSTVIDFTGKSSYLPEVARVEIRSKNLITGILAEGDHPKISLNNVPLESKQAVVFSFVPIFED
ncbi:neutral and basic amino acid transport protein rBAT-like isoform X2 [Stegodyphus dumicola]|uniref:neutral and basic amino acid transport protein rBAT-like isoform X2 n=1 Tax=Stegodyphus dumicola TaxID=202533 RepID=UPI0015AC116C|nr:neutral and basic amino acid transport protein rBAT-like isoform X2 [Stegodyphus dumicola]